MKSTIQLVLVLHVMRDSNQVYFISSFLEIWNLSQCHLLKRLSFLAGWQNNLRHKSNFCVCRELFGVSSLYSICVNFQFIASQLQIHPSLLACNMRTFSLASQHDAHLLSVVGAGRALKEEGSSRPGLGVLSFFLLLCWCVVPPMELSQQAYSLEPPTGSSQKSSKDNWQAS